MHTTTPMEMYKKIDRASDPQKVWHSSKTYYVNVHVQTNCNKNQPDLNVIRHRPEQKKKELLLWISLNVAVLEFNYLLYSAPAAVRVLVRPPYTFVHDVPKFDYFILSHCRHKY